MKAFRYTPVSIETLITNAVHKLDFNEGEINGVTKQSLIEEAASEIYETAYTKHYEKTEKIQPFWDHPTLDTWASRYARLPKNQFLYTLESPCALTAFLTEQVTSMYEQGGIDLETMEYESQEAQYESLCDAETEDRKLEER